MTSVKKHIVVETSQQRAFRVFTDGISRWWPREHHVGASPLERMIVEPHAGGRWYSICQDGSEVEVGKVLAWHPPDRLVLAWQLTAQWQYDPSFSTEVEVGFIAEGPRRTRVELEHRQLERFGGDAETMQTTFDSDDAWAGSLAAFARTTTLAKFVAIYEVSPDGYARAREVLPAHITHLDRFQAQGTLLMAGPLGSPPTRALSVFTTREAAEAFVRSDPFVVHGVAASWTVLEWHEGLA